MGFTLALLPIVLTPGASFTLVTAKGVAGDRRGALATIAGTGLGILSHACLAGLGLAGLVTQSAEMYQAIRLAGAAYLVGLGLWMVWQGRRFGRPAASTGTKARPQAPGAALGAAYLANVLNVKAAAVYLTLAPQFIPAEQMGVSAMLVLGACHVALMAGWLGVWGSGIVAARRRLNLARWRSRIEQVGGAVLIALGIRTAVTDGGFGTWEDVGMDGLALRPA